MAAATLESIIEKEFAEVQKTRAELLAKRAEIDEQLSALDLRIRAAENYRATLEGRFNATPTRDRKPRAPSTRAPRGAREELKTKIIDVLKTRQEGLVSDQINQALGATEQKERQQIANVLSLMKKDGALQQEARRGPYSLPE